MVAFLVKDDYRDKGIASELLAQLIHIAGKRGIQGFVAVMLVENTTMQHVFSRAGFVGKPGLEKGVFQMNLVFGENRSLVAGGLLKIIEDA